MRASHAALAAAIALSTLAPASALADTCYTIELHGDPQGIASSASNLFDHIPALYPGQSEYGCAIIENASSAPQRVWLAIEDWAAEKEGQAARLLTDVTCSILCDGQEVYSGPVGGQQPHEAVMLGELEPGEGLELSYELAASSSIGNDLAGLANAVRWTLTAEELSEGDPSIEPGDEGSASPSGSTGLVKTGDRSLAAAAVLSVIAAGALAVSSAWNLKRKDGAR